jgi:hypothetical protein
VCKNFPSYSSNCSITPRVQKSSTDQNTKIACSQLSNKLPPDRNSISDAQKEESAGNLVCICDAPLRRINRWLFAGAKSLNGEQSPMNELAQRADEEEWSHFSKKEY